MQENAIHYITSYDLALGEPIEKPGACNAEMEALPKEQKDKLRRKFKTCRHVSAGHHKPEYAMAGAWPAIIEELQKPATTYEEILNREESPWSSSEESEDSEEKRKRRRRHTKHKEEEDRM